MKTNQTTSRLQRSALSGTLLAAGTALLASASFAPAAVTIPSAILGTVQDTDTTDSQGFIFDNVLSTTTATIGDAATSTPRFRVGIVEFNIDANRTEIAAATQILLSVTVNAVGGNPAGWSLGAYGFTNNDNENGTVGIAPNATTFSSNDDGRTPATQSGATYLASGISSGNILTFDVTELVKADGLDITNDFSGFRLAPTDMVLGNGTTNGTTAAISLNSNADFIQFNAAQLIIIPEPSAFILGSLGALVLLRRRR